MRNRSGTRSRPDGIEERHRALNLGCGYGLALSSRELVTQLDHALLELVVALVELGRPLGVTPCVLTSSAVFK
jgi:hypothetical protein